MKTILIIISVPLILLTIINGIQKLIKHRIDKDNALSEERKRVNQQVDVMTGLLAEIFIDTLKNQKFTSDEITNIRLCYVASVQKALNQIREI